MARGFPTDRDAVLKFARTYRNKHGKWPSQQLVADKFDVAQSTAGNIMRTVKDDPQGPGPGRVPSRLAAEMDRAVLVFVRKFILKNGWAPSQREIATAVKCQPHTANHHLHRLQQQGLIELGPNPREVRVVGASMVIPEVTL